MVKLNKINLMTEEEKKEKNREAVKKYREANKEKTKESQKKWREENKEKIKEYYDLNKEKIKIYGENNKEKIKESNKKWREENKEKIKEVTKNYAKEYYKNNKEKINNYKKKYKEVNKEKIKEYRKQYMKNRLNSDIVFKIKQNIRNLISFSIKSKGLKKNSKTENILGCSFDEFKKHLEAKFEDWMNWENYGNPKDGILEFNKNWDLDHIVPISTATTEEEIIKLNHYLNFQPLCSKINRQIKQNKVVFEK